MKTPLIKAYGNGIAQETTRQMMKDTTVKSAKTYETTKIKTDKNDAILSKYSSVNPEKIITKTEREFFVNMFPESAEQLEKHVLFTKNGRTASPEIYKGTLVDGRV